MFSVLGGAAAVLIFQLFIPPVIGLADQGDFRRTIGRLGYGPVHPEGSLNIAFVEPKYRPDSNFRARSVEQFTSEYLFVGAAVILNKLLFGGSMLDIRIVGLIHGLAFFAIFTRFLLITRDCPAAPFLWVSALIIFTDVGYVAYWNSLFMEPASGLFALLLLTESVDICLRRAVSASGLARWSLWAILLVLAKPQNSPLGLLLGMFCALRLSSWTASTAARYGAWTGSLAIIAAAVMSYRTAPVEIQDANTYNMVFLAIVPESRNPETDLKALGLDPKLRYYSTTGAWSTNSAYGTLHQSGEIGKVVTLRSIVRFYAMRPARMWRHIKAELPIATSLRPEWSGNFEPSVGRQPGERSYAIALWSAFHAGVLIYGIKYIVLLLPVLPLWALSRRILSEPEDNPWIEFSGLLALCTLVSFLTALFGDAWDNVRHLYLFNLLLDAGLLGGITFVADCWLRLARIA